MELRLSQGLMMGLFSGLAEPLPVSGDAHQALLRYLFGIEAVEPLFSLLCHLAVLAALLMTGRLELPRLYRTWKQLRLPPRRRTHQPDLNSINTLKLLRNAALIVFAGRLLGARLADVLDKPYILSITLIIGGMLLWIPSQYRSANKDARILTPADGLIFGAAATLGAIPGFSAVGVCMAAAQLRGTDRRYALRFSWLLLVFALLAMIVSDALALVAAGFAYGMWDVVVCLAGAACAAFGCWASVRLMNAICRKDISNFCYYSWGMALLVLALYLFV